MVSKALKDPDGEYADYFYFRKGKNGNPPSNYRSYFGGSCWEKVPGTDKYYLHMFAKEQPDLNWENEKLRQKLYEMINWWLDKGLSGFRIDAIINIKKISISLILSRMQRTDWLPATRWLKVQKVSESS